MGKMDFGKEKKRHLVRYMNDILKDYSFLINDCTFFKFIYLFKTFFSLLHKEKKLATFENIILFLKNRINDPENPAYKQSYKEFYFMPRYLYNASIYYGLDFDAIIEACRTTLILLVHDIPDEKIEETQRMIESEIEKITGTESSPYVYKIIEKEYDKKPKNFAMHIHDFHQKLELDALRMCIDKSATISNIMFTYDRIGISSSLTTHIIEKIKIDTDISEKSDFTNDEDSINNIREKNKEILRQAFAKKAETMSQEDTIKLYTQIGWSRRFIYKIVGENT
jgi:hypothetical protein